jgi:rfaE bifunctional protein kinase chain/domain
MIKTNKKELKDFLRKIRRIRIAIIGDIMLDTFEYGKITRISPEANVPVILIDKIESMPGGAGNVARNIKHLNSNPILISNTGNDADGKTLRTTLESEKITTDGISYNKKVTITKKRVLVDGKHFARVDKEIIKASTKKEEEKIITYFKKNISKIDCVIFSDYCKGTITKKIVNEICYLSNKKKIPIIVDSKPKNASLYKGKKVSVVTPNVQEAKEMSGKETLQDMANYLQNHFSSAVLITRGADGMTLFENNLVVHQNAITNNAVDVSGCGDTVVAVLALALAVGISKSDAIYFSNYAANIVVQKSGTSTVSPREFITSIEKILI